MHFIMAHPFVCGHLGVIKPIAIGAFVDDFHVDLDHWFAGDLRELGRRPTVIREALEEELLW